MSKKIDLEQRYHRKEEGRKKRAKLPIAEKLAIAEELRDLQRVLAPIREANRVEVRRKRDRN